MSIPTDRGHAMRLPRFRFTLRRMVIVVAIVGALFGAEVTRRRRAVFLRRADGCRQMYVVCKRVEDSGRELVPILERGIKEARDFANKYRNDEQIYNEQIQIIEFYKQRIDEQIRLTPHDSMETTYWLNLTRKYERATRYPWLSIEPDPPQPE